MKLFYGVYLADPTLATTFDLIRFLAEPDGYRFSHITLRGPLSRRLGATWLDEQNKKTNHDWQIKLTKPGRFMADHQSTVYLSVELGTLSTLWHKPDFQDGVPHLTLYDGKSQDFATKLRNLLAQYDFNCWVRVTKLSTIQKKHKIDEVFQETFEPFCRMFAQYVGEPRRITRMRYATETERLNLIDNVLAGTFHSPQVEKRMA